MLLGLSAAAGFIGVGISIIAYLPQIIHLIREHCSAGISRTAFGLWLVSSCLVTFHAIVIRDKVFILLGCAQILTSFLIYIFGTKYRDGICESHLRVTTSGVSKHS